MSCSCGCCQTSRIAAAGGSSIPPPPAPVIPLAQDIRTYALRRAFTLGVFTAADLPTVIEDPGEALPAVNSPMWHQVDGPGQVEFVPTAAAFGSVWRANSLAGDPVPSSVTVRPTAALATSPNCIPNPATPVVKGWYMCWVFANPSGGPGGRAYFEFEPSDGVTGAIAMGAFGADPNFRGGFVVTPGNVPTAYNSGVDMGTGAYHYAELWQLPGPGGAVNIGLDGLPPVAFAVGNVSAFMVPTIHSSSNSATPTHLDTDHMVILQPGHIAPPYPVV